MKRPRLNFVVQHLLGLKEALGITKQATLAPGGRR
jgi:hypothetical protein